MNSLLEGELPPPAPSRLVPEDGFGRRFPLFRFPFSSSRAPHTIESNSVSLPPHPHHTVSTISPFLAALPPACCCLGLPQCHSAASPVYSHNPIGSLLAPSLPSQSVRREEGEGRELVKFVKFAGPARLQPGWRLAAAGASGTFALAVWRRLRSQFRRERGTFLRG